MAELLGVAEVVVIHGYCIGEATGRALRIPDADEDAEPGDTIVAPVVSEPVALQDQKTLPMLRALSAHAHIQAQPVRTTPDDATGYYALGSLSTNDPDVEPYAGRKVTLPDGTAKVIQLAYNATPYTVDAKMAAQVNAGRPTPLVTVGQQVRAVWLPDAAEYVAPDPGGPAYYTAAQVDSLLAGLLDNAATDDDITAAITAVLGGVSSDFNTLAKLATAVQANATAIAARVAKATFTAKGDLLAASAASTPERLPIASDGRVLTADSTVPLGVSWQNPTGGGGGGGSGSPDLPEAARLAYTAAVSPPSDLLSKTTRYTTASAITQTLPLAQAGRVLAVGWDFGTAALTLAGASRIDGAGGTGTVAVTASSATVSDTNIAAQDQGRLVTGTGIPAATYVGTVTPGTSFLLSSSPATQVNVNATASSTAVTLTDIIGAGTATTRLLETPGEVLALHATSNGQWRVYSAFRPSERLTSVEKNADYTAQPGELVVMDTTGGARTVTAPASGVGRAFAVKNKTGTNLVNVVRAGSDTFGSAGATTIPVRYDDQVTHFAWNPNTPTNWLIPQNHLPPTAVMANETGVAFRAHNASGTAQAIPTGADTIVAFPTVSRTSSLVTQSTQGAGHKFTLGRAGVWVGTINVRLPGAAAGECYLALRELVSNTTVDASGGSVSTAAASTRIVPIAGYFDAGAQLYASLFQSSGASQSIDQNAGQACHIQLAWVHP